METKPSPAPSLFLGSLAPDLAADRVGVLSQGVASSSELSRGCLKATYMAMGRSWAGITWGNRGSERSSDMPAETQLGYGVLGLWLRSNPQALDADVTRLPWADNALMSSIAGSN